MTPRNFSKRYLFKGTLSLKTGLHIGGGESFLNASDSPVIRTADGTPFIPGSSFKGAFRSTVEKLTPMIGALWSCTLDGDTFTQNGEEKIYCIGPQGKAQKEFNGKREAKWSDKKLLEELDAKLCHTCKLFGSPYMASRITFADLYTTDYTAGLVQVRNGVAIDRDSEQAVDGLLYDYEVVAPAVTFNMEIWLDDPSEIDLGLTCVGLSEFISGFGFLGGKRSRGLGQCELSGLEVYHVDLSKPDSLVQYLTHKKIADKMQKKEQSEEFIYKSIKYFVDQYTK